MITISIIGSSGSHNKMGLFSNMKINEMISQVELMISQFGLQWNDIELWSGGSSGADHIAVLLALKYGCKLKLFLPCNFNEKFFDNGNYDYKSNCGKLLNELHSQFSNQVCFNTFRQLEIVLSLHTSTCSIHNGFHDRNNFVAQSDILIAFTPSTTNSPIDGGTLYTWNKSKSLHKIHIKI